MPVTLSIKNAPDDVVEALRQRARANHRSLQGELLAIIEEATRRPVAAPDRVAEVLARAKARNLPQDGESSTDMIRRWRDSGYSLATNPTHHADTEADFGEPSGPPAPRR
jgi:plasmid stability protein